MILKVAFKFEVIAVTHVCRLAVPSYQYTTTWILKKTHDLRDRSAVRDHAHRAHHLREVTARDDGRRLVVDAALEARRGPVDELDRALRLDRRHGSVDILFSQQIMIDDKMKPNVTLFE